MRIIFVPTVAAVIAVNKLVCEDGGNPHVCVDSGKIESAISTAFYPGTYPFVHGGLAGVAGALCFYLVKAHAFADGNKRTGALTAITFLNNHGMDLGYPVDELVGLNGLSEIVDQCAASEITKEELIDWFEQHKIYLEEE